jgi:DNA-binding XRE family transcriptional regulator
MTKVLEKISDLDRFESKLLKRPGYKKIDAETKTVSKIAAKVILYRQAHNLTQAGLAKKAGLSRKAVNEIEGLTNINPSLKTLEALAGALQMPLEKFVA